MAEKRHCKIVFVSNHQSHISKVGRPPRNLQSKKDLRLGSKCVKPLGGKEGLINIDQVLTDALRVVLSVAHSSCETLSMLSIFQLLTAVVPSQTQMTAVTFDID